MSSSPALITDAELIAMLKAMKFVPHPGARPSRRIYLSPRGFRVPVHPAEQHPLAFASALFAMGGVDADARDVIKSVRDGAHAEREEG